MPVRFVITTLKPGVDPVEYEHWVRERDYALARSKSIRLIGRGALALVMLLLPIACAHRAGCILSRRSPEFFSRRHRLRSRWQRQHNWIEKSGQTTWVPNAVIQAAESLGHGDVLREILKTEGLMEGKPFLRLEVAIELAANATRYLPIRTGKRGQRRENRKRNKSEYRRIPPITDKRTHYVSSRTSIEDTALLKRHLPPRTGLCRDRGHEF